MNDLTIVQEQGKLLVDSRQVAEMVNKRHDHLLRDIKGYCEILADSTAPKFGVSDFFIESTYQDITGRTLPRYSITKKGCEMVANKLTGKKGVLFTAAYVTKFDEMEKRLNTPPIETQHHTPESIEWWKEARENRIGFLRLENQEIIKFTGLDAAKNEGELEEFIVKDIAKIFGNEPSEGDPITDEQTKYYYTGPKPLGPDLPLEADYPKIPAFQIRIQQLQATGQLLQITA